MSIDPNLLDTPKRTSLQSQSVQIRAALKDFERSFAANNNGRKPSKEEIKADTYIAAKYKEYSRVRDALEGRLDYATYIAGPKSPLKRRRRHERTDSNVGRETEKRHQDGTPKRSLHPSQLDPYDFIGSSSPKPVLLHAIGPTPQRDGKVLGLFDLLSNSAHSSKATPSSRKRKLDALIAESPQKCEPVMMAQTPSQKKTRDRGDLLEYLSGTPQTSLRKHSRTPISEGKKFMLSQFFATPSTARFANVGANSGKEQTPLRDRLLGLTPRNSGQAKEQASDATPAYLRRSTSFKDRLLSASQSSVQIKFAPSETLALQAGPPTLKHLRSVPRPFNDLESNFPDVEEENDEDDMEALREMEHNELNILAKDSQQQLRNQAESESVHTGNDTNPPPKVWKKRGQKRTTRRANMKPAFGKLADAPKFVAAGGLSDDDEDILQADENYPGGQTTDAPDDDFDGLANDENDDVLSTDDFGGSKNRTKTIRKTSKTMSTKKTSKKPSTINPNATTHMNFRSLKIKNKNSKAKGRARFSRGRR